MTLLINMINLDNGFPSGVKNTKVYLLHRNNWSKADTTIVPYYCCKLYANCPYYCCKLYANCYLKIIQKNWLFNAKNWLLLLQTLCKLLFKNYSKKLVVQKYNAIDIFSLRRNRRRKRKKADIQYLH